MPEVALTVDGKKVPLNPQMQMVFAEVNLGIIRTLKGVGEAKSFEITVKS